MTSLNSVCMPVYMEANVFSTGKGSKGEINSICLNAQAWNGNQNHPMSEIIGSLNDEAEVEIATQK